MGDIVCSAVLDGVNLERVTSVFAGPSANVRHGPVAEFGLQQAQAERQGSGIARARTPAGKRPELRESILEMLPFTRLLS